MTLYLVFLIVGLVVFSLAIFGGIDHDFDTHFDFHHDFDGHADTDTDSPGLFSIRTISAFLAGFGVAGICAKTLLNWSIGGQLFLGFLIGFVMMFFAFLIIKAFYSQQAGEVKDAKNLVGKSGTITIASGDQGLGEIYVDNLYYTCKDKSDKPLRKSQTVKVIEAQEGLLIVEKI